MESSYDDLCQPSGCPYGVVGNNLLSCGDISLGEVTRD